MSVLSESRTSLRLAVLLLAGAALGFAAGMAAQDRAAAHIFPSDLLMYSYGNDLCLPGDEIDPVNVVFTNYGFPSEIGEQVDNHGGWEKHGGAQYFGDQYDCFEMDGDSAQCNVCLGRFHVRYYNHKGANGGLRTVSPHGSIASGTAHHEDTVPCGINPGAHAIDDDSESFTIAGFTGGGGFNRGREDVRKNWVVNADHVLEASHYWNNTLRIEQCNGNVASSDGWVYYIRTFDATADTDSDGCTTEQELQTSPGSETTGGLRSPIYFWDFYDVWSLDGGGGWLRDKVINIPGDILGVTGRFGQSTPLQSKASAFLSALAPPVDSTGYHAAFDRGPIIGPNHWDREPPDGTINIPADILGVAAQFGHDCT